MSYLLKRDDGKYWTKYCGWGSKRDAHPFREKQPETLGTGERYVKLVKAKKTYANTGAQIGTLVEEKQLQYGDSHGKAGAVLNILYPDGIKPEQFASALTVTRVIDKLFRIATDNDKSGESPWTDIAGYSLLQIGRT